MASLLHWLARPCSVRRTLDGERGRPCVSGPEYSVHARERMRERRISEAEVEDVLTNHHTRYPDREGNAVLIGHPGGRRIKVVVRKDSDPPFIITTAD